MARIGSVAMAAALLVAGCKTTDSRSTVELDDQVEASLEKAGIKMCGGTTLVTFIGNAEPLGPPPVFFKGTDGRAIDAATVGEIRRSEDTEVRKFLRSVLVAAEGLESAFSRTPKCSGQSYTDEHFVLLTITDGPGASDSRIHSVVYGWVKAADADAYQWQKISVQEWSWSDAGGLTEARPGEPLELDMPKAVPLIVQAFNDGAPKKYGFPTGFTHHIYFIKAHGGLVAPESSILPTLEHAVDKEPAPKAMHAFMFDPHGPGGAALTSKLYRGYWRRSDILATCEARWGTADPLCRTFASQAPKTAGPDGGTSGPDAGTSGPDAGTSGPDAGTSGPDAGTSGPDAGTSGPDAGTSGPDAGTSGADAGTAGTDVGTAGTGKGLLFTPHFTGDPTTLSQGPDGASMPLGLRWLGYASTFTWFPKPVTGMWIFKLPGDFRAPALVVLDSCYGTDDGIAKALTPPPTPPHAPVPYVVVLTNPKPLYYDLVDYTALDAHEIRMLPWLLSTMHPIDAGPAWFAAKQELLDHLGGGLKHSSQALPQADYTRLRVDLYDQGTKREQVTP